MNENPWRILAELGNLYASDGFEQVQGATKTAAEQLHLPQAFLQRLNTALQETIINRRPEEEPNYSPTVFRILSNCTASPTPSWGFFFIEKDQTIELYLYQDGK